MNFPGKHIVLTGGSSGIGRAAATILAREGARVSSLDLTPPTKKIDGVTHVHCDVSRFGDVRKALAETGGGIDLLMSNAGVMRRGTILESTEADFDALFDVHVKGAWMLAKEAWPLLTPHGEIAFTASAHALRPPKDPGLYALSKRALAALAEQLRAHHPEHRARTLFLGPTDTPLARHDVPTETMKEKEKIMWSADDVAREIVEFLRTDECELRYDNVKNVYVAS